MNNNSTSLFEHPSENHRAIIAPMIQSPTLAELLKQAIENRLLDLHTAMIARVESYDAQKQQVNVSPVLKRSIKSLDGLLVSEQLPMLCDVPVLFPRAGGYFISFPIKPGDFVQLVFNESSIDEWLLGGSSELGSTHRFTLQGAVAIPGVYPESRSIRGAHEANFVAGKEDGLQIHIDDQKIRLGSADASEALAIASRVKAELEKIKTAFQSHTHAYPSTPITPSISAPTTTMISPISNISTQYVVAK